MSVYLQLLFPEVNDSNALPLPAQPKRCGKQKAKQVNFSSRHSYGKYQLIKNGWVIKRFDSFYEAYQYGLHKFQSSDFLVR